ncbi:uncharacterized protein LOC141865890 isoform X3 [Acropora palmata]|uniref:uncharacterized protein LOC141865890 isoform X3 n=1 Tax=Acropora palmata TaxID=6131 RepID=UPI003DA01D32
MLMPQGAVSRTSVRLGSRSDETSRCEGLLQGSCTENPSLVPLLNHSFEEICWQAYEDRRALVVVLLNPSGKGQFKAKMLSVLQNLQDNSRREDWFFWAAETTSDNGKKVLEKYGNGSEDQTIFLVPSTRQTPVFVDRIEGPVLTDFDQTRLFDKIKAMIHGLSIEREQQEQWRQLRKQQEDELQQVISGTHHQLSIVEDNLATDEDQAINQTQDNTKDKTCSKEHDNGNSEEVTITVSVTIFFFLSYTLIYVHKDITLLQTEHRKKVKQQVQSRQVNFIINNNSNNNLICEGRRLNETARSNTNRQGVPKFYD